MTTLIEFQAEIKPAKTHALPESTGKSLYGFFLYAVRLVDPSLAKLIHDYTGPKPFTVSRLIGYLKKENGKFFVLEDKTYKVRFTSFSDLISRALIEVLSPVYASREKILLWGEEFELQGFSVASLNGYPPVTTTNDLEKIALRLAENEDKIIIDFLTETAFRYKDENILFPLPDVLFSSAVKRARNAMNEIREKSDWIKRVRISRYDLKTSVVNFERIPFQGFKGTVEYDISKLSQEEKAYAFLLSLLFNYVGVGTKTTMGMGQACMNLNRTARGDFLFER